MLKTIGALCAPAQQVENPHAPRWRASSGAAPAPASEALPGGAGGHHQAAPRGGPAAPPEAVACHMGRSTFSVQEGREARRTAGKEGVRGGTPRPTRPPQAAADGMLHPGGGDAVASTRPDGRNRPADAVSVGAGGPVPVLDNRHSISSAGLFNVKEIHVMTDGRVLINPRTGEIVEAVLASRRIFKADKYAEPKGVTQKSKSKNVENSVDGRGAARAKRRVFELAACNDFSLFFTLTLNPEKIDRYDYKAAVKRFGVWASNRVQRHGLRYVAVPELHQDGAIHFHGLCAGDDTLLSEAPVKWKGKQVYNLDWDIGYSTAVKLTGDTLRAARYVAKYVTKQTGGGTIGGRYFFHGGPLVGFHVQHFQGAGAPLTGHRVEVPDAGLALLYIDLKDPRNVEILGDLVQNRKGV